MLENGDEKRVRLIRPMEGGSLPAAELAETVWADADRARFTQAWESEVNDTPPFTERTIYMVSGLLLPIWKRLPEQNTRVYRLQTDEGERIIGRKVSAAWAAAAGAPAVSLTPHDAFAVLRAGDSVIALADGLELRRVRVMHGERIELIGFTDAMRERLTAYGLFHEIISYKLRMFVPIDANGVVVLEQLLNRFPIERTYDRTGRHE